MCSCHLALGLSHTLRQDKQGSKVAQRFFDGLAKLLELHSAEESMQP